ncbi:prostaglandin E2 receptor EP1 subtype-like [Sinocyclocheilus grahami]|uniref:prostaglandin E2 receptor EP1 subtype-like n=1 Tax=Sinocyclocheilus grahami TaxID=75366 RepID=UPI0007AD58C9|nr:PREDICTED: prostaglandin E2 receptor EP1 subtype-like [Sinocyclocheilus grahami]
MVEPLGRQAEAEHGIQRLEAEARDSSAMFICIYLPIIQSLSTPLLLGSAMAVERCIGITQPLLHPTIVTMTRVRLTVLLITFTALVLAGLPLLNVGNYKPQFPGTWCFLPVNSLLSITDANLALAFSTLGLVTLTVSVVSNTISGLKLLQARFKDRCVKSSIARRHGSFPSSSLHSLDVEMMTQLAAITVVSCVCWSPFLGVVMKK